MIYKPKGRAREYSPYALNIYMGCKHGCIYCYAPRVRRMSDEKFHGEELPRKNFSKALLAAAAKFEGLPKQVLLTFIGDPYCAAEKQLGLTRDTITILLYHRIPVAVLSKGGQLALRDLSIFTSGGDHIKYGASLTFASAVLSRKWEPGAALPEDRISTLQKFKAAGVKTWASFEPVVVPAESLAIMKRALPYVDEFRLGKLNQYQGLDTQIDWAHEFLIPALNLLRPLGKQIYVKQDLREAACSVQLRAEECDCDQYLARPFI